MSQIPSGTELARPFLPSQDFDLSKRFYVVIGFEKILDGDVAIFEIGFERLYPADHYSERMGRELHDAIDGRRSRRLVVAHNCPGSARHFGVPAPQPPAMQPWGLRVAYLVDPCGVLWHVAQRRQGLVQD